MLIRSLLFSAIIAISTLVLASCGVYSQGERSGQVTKLSTKGLIFKTKEGQLVMSGMKNVSDSEGRSSIVANTFEFSVVSPEVAKDVSRAARDGVLVTLVDSYTLETRNED